LFKEEDMIKLRTSQLMKRLVANFFLIALISISIITGIAYYYCSNALKDAAFNELYAVSEIKKNEVINYFSDRISDVTVLSKLNDTINGYQLLKKYHDAGGGDPNGGFDISTQTYKDIYATMGSFLNTFLSQYQYIDIYMICAEHGHVMYSIKREHDLGTNLGNGPYRESLLAELWSSVVKNRRPIITDFKYYEPAGKAVQFVGTPLLDEKGNTIAVIALQLSPKLIDTLMQEKSGMGQSGESYLVGDDYTMRSNSRFDKQTTILVKRIDTVAVQRGLQDIIGMDIIKDYRGVNVLSRYSHLGLNEKFFTTFEWIIISEIDKSEAFQPVKELGWILICIGLILSFIAAIIGYFAANAIANPLSEGANTLASSISEISSTTTQLASSAAETSTSIAEITTTLEQVRQTVEISNSKADQVVDRSTKASQISDTGKKATEDTIQGIKVIREEMEYIAESIVKLSEQTQSIGKIIGAVTDLADQSNLLSVNASIEAAKAGEQGKGFAVVAQEVKSLAEQSKDATNQVKTILDDIQKATSAAVMATERGGKAVEAGVKLSAEAGESIRALATSVSESGQAAMQIAASSKEQLTGTEQLVMAMENIKEGSIQNVEGARQLEEAIKNLDNLAKKLKDIAG